jgi:hypothetical protein
MHVVMVREDFDTGDTELAIFETEMLRRATDDINEIYRAR